MILRFLTYNSSNMENLSKWFLRLKEELNMYLSVNKEHNILDYKIILEDNYIFNVLIIELSQESEAFKMKKSSGLQKSVLSIKPEYLKEILKSIDTLLELTALGSRYYHI